jgi:hypothetical protein
MNWALIIHDDPDMRESLCGIVEKKLGLPGDSVIAVQNYEAVSDRLLLRYGLGNCQVVIASFGAPASAAQSPALEGDLSTAHAFLQKLRGVKADLPFIFLTRLVDESVQNAVADLPNTRLLKIKHFSETLAPAIGQLVLHERPDIERPPHDVDLDIWLMLGGACAWHIRGPKGDVKDLGGNFDIDKGEIKELVKFSKAAAEGEDRAASLRLFLIEQLGRRLYEMLFANSLKNDKLEPRLTQQIHVKGSDYLEAVRFRFHLDSDTSELLVETLGESLSEGEKNKIKYWMLSAPICRKYGNHGERYALFKDPVTQTGAINCLIIQGQAGQFEAGPPVRRRFPEIRLARQEAAELGKTWDRHKADFRIDTLRLMQPEDYVGKNYGAAVRTVLAEGHWHLVHYAGHSTVAEGRGYLVLGDGPDDILDIDTFARSTRDTQFVFLNSCSSAKGEFIARLVEKNIPAVLGYAWPLDDTAALAFSRKFYDELFNGKQSTRFLEYSFMRAKAHLYNTFRDQPAWAAPLLFLQTSESDRN